MTNKIHLEYNLNVMHQTITVLGTYTITNTLKPNQREYIFQNIFQNLILFMCVRNSCTFNTEQRNI